MRYLKNKLCPFNNIVSSCTKNSIELPLGVCSLNHKNKPVIICPVRFREDWKIMTETAAFVFNETATWTHLAGGCHANGFLRYFAATSGS